jgi:2-haloacid dehalogenase
MEQETAVIDDLPMSRRKLLMGVGVAATGSIAASVTGQAAPALPAFTPPKPGSVVPSIIAFDVNESTLDINHLSPLFQRLFGDGKAVNEWYAQLVVYMQAITLAGGPYTTFFNLSQAVFKMMGAVHGVTIKKSDLDELETLSATMPAHPDEPAGLKQLKDAGFKLITLTNSPPEAQVKQLKYAGLDGYYDRLFSVDRVRRYKPAPQTYHMVAEEMNVTTAEICLVSVHVWDGLGAQNAGCASALIARAGNTPPPTLDIPGWPVPSAYGPDLPSVATQMIKLWRS